MWEKVSLARMEMQISSRSSSVMGKRSSDRFLPPSDVMGCDPCLLLKQKVKTVEKAGETRAESIP
jgi:hypothetical protein